MLPKIGSIAITWEKKNGQFCEGQKSTDQVIELRISADPLEPWTLVTVILKKQ